MEIRRSVMARPNLSCRGATVITRQSLGRVVAKWWTKNGHRLRTNSGRETRTSRKTPAGSFPFQCALAREANGVSTGTLGMSVAGTRPRTPSLATGAFGYAHGPRRSETNPYYRCASEGKGDVQQRLFVA